MSQHETKIIDDARTQTILDAASDLIVHYGYDKTTMSDIADRAGVTRAIVYLHFENRDRLFEALLYRETERYFNTWLETLEDPARLAAGRGALAQAFLGALVAANHSPFLSAMLKQDRRMFGKYLGKPGNLFESVQSVSLWPQTLQALQHVGAVRQDLPPDVMGYLMNALALGLMAMEDRQGPGARPTFDAILEAAAEVMDRVFTPEGGGNQEAGRAVLLQMARAVQAQFAQAS